MLQRVQTIYLLMTAIISGGLVFICPIWKLNDGLEVFATSSTLYSGLFFGSAIVSLIAIFMFKNRKLQFVLGRLAIILNFILLGFFVYQSLMVSGEAEASEKGIGMFLPIVSIVFLALANKAIKKDEDLVKSVDRLR